MTKRGTRARDREPTTVHVTSGRAAARLREMTDQISKPDASRRFFSMTTVTQTHTGDPRVVCHFMAHPPLAKGGPVEFTVEMVSKRGTSLRDVRSPCVRLRLYDDKDLAWQNRELHLDSLFYDADASERGKCAMTPKFDTQSGSIHASAVLDFCHVLAAMSGVDVVLQDDARFQPHSARPPVFPVTYLSGEDEMRLPLLFERGFSFYEARGFFDQHLVLGVLAHAKTDIDQQRDDLWACMQIDLEFRHMVLTTPLDQLYGAIATFHERLGIVMLRLPLYVQRRYLPLDARGMHSVPHVAAQMYSQKACEAHATDAAPQIQRVRSLIALFQDAHKQMFKPGRVRESSADARMLRDLGERMSIRQFARALRAFEDERGYYAVDPDDARLLNYRRARDGSFLADFMHDVRARPHRPRRRPRRRSADDPPTIRR